MAASGACKRTRRALLLLLAAVTGVAALGRRHTTLWINTRVPADIEYAEQHAEALTRVIPAYGCWRIADNGSHSGIAPECGPQTLGGLHQKGIELWPEVGISKKSIVSGSWRPALARNGTLGPLMREWGWKGVFLDEEEPQNTPLCRKSRCGDPEKHCPACTPQVSAAQYATFLAEFSAALKVYGLGLQIFVGMDAPGGSIILDRRNATEHFSEAMAPVGGKLAVAYPFYYGGTADKQQKELIARYKERRQLRQLNLMFGGQFRELIKNGTGGRVVNTSDLAQCPVRNSRPPCPHINFHWSAADYNSTIDWLAFEGACEVTIYPGPGGNLRAGGCFRGGCVAEPGRQWTKLLAGWMIEGLRRFKYAPLGQDAVCA